MSSFRQFLDVFRFELRFRRKHIPTWIFAAIFALLAFLAISTDVAKVGGSGGPIARNSTIVIMVMMTIFNMLGGLIVATAFVAPAVNRDQDWGIQSLFFATPLRKTPYLLGRFCGALVVTAFVMAFVPFGILVGTLMPWQEADKIIAFTPMPYIWGMCVLVLPTLFMASSIFFAVATFTRKTFYAYVSLVALIVGYTVAMRWIGDLDSELAIALSDPFGMAPLQLAARYWTVAEQNHALPSLTDGYIGLNRLLWTGVGAVVLGITVARYRMEVAHDRKRSAVKDEAPVLKRQTTVLPKTPRDFGAGARWVQFLSQTRLEVRGLLSTLGFRVLMLFGAAMVVGTSFALVSQGGTTTHPVTHIMLNSIEGGMSLFLLIIIIFYSGELLHRERKVKMNELFDSLPLPNWIPAGAKFIALLAGAAVVLAGAC